MNPPGSPDFGNFNFKLKFNLKTGELRVSLSARGNMESPFPIGQNRRFPESDASQSESLALAPGRLRTSRRTPFSRAASAENLLNLNGTRGPGRRAGDFGVCAAWPMILPCFQMGRLG